jgi:general stress protein 26
VPLWFSWDGRAVWTCTGATSATARNVRTEPRVHLALPDGPYLYVRVEPTTVRAWRGEQELRGRVIMRDGVWLG